MEEVRTFRADTLQEALQLVRHSLGPDAAVLTTRNLKVNRLGLFPKTMIEVEASVDKPTGRRFTDEQMEAVAVTASPTPPIEQTSTPESQPAPVRPQPTLVRRRDMSPAGVEGLGSQGTKTTSADIERPADLPGRGVSRAELKAPRRETPTAATVTVLTELLENGVEPTYAKALVTAATQKLSIDAALDPLQIRQQLHRLIIERLECGGTIKPTVGERQVVAFVGPTGSGKTSTLAKVAASARFETGCQVGMITVDTFRLGAVDQLLQYAELMSASLEVVSSSDQIGGALERLADCDLVLIDTAGRSHRDAEQLVLLKELIQAAQPDLVQLVVSATCARAQVCDTLDKFSDVGPTQLLITKLDEAVAFGEWISVLCEATLPVSYLTTGQHVPQDISVASPRRLANLLLGNSSYDAAVPASSVD